MYTFSPDWNVAASFGVMLYIRVWWDELARAVELARAPDVAPIRVVPTGIVPLAELYENTIVLGAVRSHCIAVSQAERDVKSASVPLSGSTMAMNSVAEVSQFGQQ